MGNWIVEYGTGLVSVVGLFLIVYGLTYVVEWVFSRAHKTVCKHKVFVDGGGPFRNDLVCERCGYRVPWLHSRRIRVSKRHKIRQLREGEMFYKDGVYRKED